jgi:hypothetical protein
VLDQGVVGALDQGQDGVLYGKTSWEGNERKRCECWSEGEGWKEEDRGRSWCLGQAFLTKFSLGGESTGSRKSAQGGEGGSWERQRRVARANTALPDGQTTRRPDYQTTRLPDYQTARLLGYRRPDCQTRDDQTARPLSLVLAPTGWSVDRTDHLIPKGLVASLPSLAHACLA